MSHIIETIPEGAEPISAHGDDFMRYISMEADETIGNVETIGHLAIVRDVSRADIRDYVSAHGDPWVSDSVRSGIVPGDYAIVTDRQGFVYGFHLPGESMGDLALDAAEQLESRFDEED